MRRAAPLLADFLLPHQRQWPLAAQGASALATLVLAQAAQRIRADPGIEQAGGSTHHIDRPAGRGGWLRHWSGGRGFSHSNSLCQTQRQLKEVR